MILTDFESSLFAFCGFEILCRVIYVIGIRHLDSLGKNQLYLMFYFNK